MTTPVPTGGNGSATDWWGPQELTPPYFPLNPSLGYVPVTPPAAPTPRFALWAFDNGFVGYVRNS